MQQPQNKAAVQVEHSFQSRPLPWRLSTAPQNFLAAFLTAFISSLSSCFRFFRFLFSFASSLAYCLAASQEPILTKSLAPLLQVPNQRGGRNVKR
jgi:hypothetical protein